MTTTITTEEVWELLSTRLGRFIRARVEDDPTASDLLQETFLRIHKKLGTLEDEERLPAWVFQIARNVIADHYRSKKSPSSLAMYPPPRPESENLNEIISGWIPGAIESLPESYRDAVTLYELEDLPQKEIAQQLGLSLSAVKSRVRRGREKLKQVLNDCCAFELDRRGNVLDWQVRNGADCGSCSDPTSAGSDRIGLESTRSNRDSNRQ